MSYIERETALQIIDNYAKAVSEDGKAVVDAIRDIVEVIAPTADVVEVVRCRDCKHYIASYCTRDIKGRTNMFYMTENDFCSYGERKEK